MNGIRFSHIALNCKDPIAQEEFYTRHFGFERARVYDPGSHEVVMIRLGDCYIELFAARKERQLAPPEKDGYDSVGMRHFCFEVDDLDALLAAMGDEAVITLGPLDMGQYIENMKVTWIKDPEGNIIELNQGYRDQITPPAFDAKLKVT
ncbi:VOC family protein [Chitinibacter sp. GC72]|uniref:VOC family protein n=1 Tax=Chitinibacter sp. GC72 TaxID=1526917 RepID=UPI0012FAC404|nr:VOC family protein [Chitinibacter sp. GC72]